MEMETVHEFDQDFNTIAEDYVYLFDVRNNRQYGFIPKSPLHNINLSDLQAVNGLHKTDDFSSGLNIVNWAKYIQQYGYWDKQLIEFIKYGFPLDIKGEFPPTGKVSNHPTAQQHPQHVWNYLCKELSLGAIIGPFDTPPINNLHCSPLLTREKSNSINRRVIVDMSWPHGGSVNDHVNKSSYLGTDFLPLTTWWIVSLA